MSRRETAMPGTDVANEPRAKPEFFNYFPLDMAVIVVGSGENQAQFQVHKDALCGYIPYFYKALCGGFREALESKITLLNEDPAVFQEILHCVYGRPMIHPSGPEDGLLLVKMWVLADRFRISGLQGNIDDNLMSFANERDVKFMDNGGVVDQCFQNPEAIELVYGSTPDSCPLRELFAAWNAWHCVSEPRNFAANAAVFENVPGFAKDVLRFMTHFSASVYYEKLYCDRFPQLWAHVKSNMQEDQEYQACQEYQEFDEFQEASFAPEDQEDQEGSYPEEEQTIGSPIICG
ncbi:MAG: hypothetical protein M4579_007240 [Chaenotheca gracillima]|nr:MAG: hypothetical protein M4579_007240 [Chaenotheca gracillima]